MSNGIYIIDPKRHGIALPEALADFGAILEKFAGVQDTVNPAFVELGRRLEAGLPPGSWLSSPAREASEVRSALWNLGLPDIEMLAAERLIAESVRELGLIAYDDQVGIGFLPDGRIAPEDMRAVWEETLASVDAGERVDGIGGFGKYVLAPLQEILAPAGFKLEKKANSESHHFVRTLDALRQEITIRPMRYGEIEMHFAVYHDGLKALWKALQPGTTYEIPAYFLDLGIFNPGPDLFPRWYIEHPRDMLPIVELMQRKAIPLANFCRDLHGLDQLMNDDSADAIRSPKGRLPGKHRVPGSDGSVGVRDRMHGWTRFVIAHLAGNPRLAEIKAQVDQLCERRADLRDEFLRVQEALQAVTPLARWRDAAQHRATLRRIPAGLLERPADPRAARLHHFEIGQQLEAAAAADPAAFLATYAGADGDEQLRRLWESHGLTLPEEDRLAADGIGRELRAVSASPAPLEVLLVRLPAATNVGEMSSIAVARRGGAHLAYTFANEYRLEEGRLVQKFVFTHGGVTSTRQHSQPVGIDDFVAHIAKTFPVPAAT